MRDGALAGVNTPDPENEGHYKMFLQELEDLRNNPDSKILPDSDLADGPKSRYEVIITIEIKNAKYFIKPYIIGGGLPAGVCVSEGI